MTQHLAAVTLVVDDYDDAVAWFVGVLGFALVEDTPLGGGKRFVRVAPRRGDDDDDDATALLLAQPKNDAERAAIGRQTGGRVAFFLHTDDFARDHASLSARGVCFVEAPRDEAYGRVVVFEDPWGNRWDLVEPAGARR